MRQCVDFTLTFSCHDENCSIIRPAVVFMWGLPSEGRKISRIAMGAAKKHSP